jgi:hypothetical protein
VNDTHLAAQAFINAINVLGERNAELIIIDLERRSLYLDDPELDLHALSDAINELLGRSAADLIFERFVIELDKLRAMPKVRV